MRAARGDGAADDAKTQKVVAELTKLISPGGSQSAPAAAASTGRGASRTRRSGGERSGSYRSSRVPALYANANEALPLLRELARLGPTEVVLDDSALPSLTDLDPEGAYLTWTVTLHSACEEQAIREVFEFVEDDCVLEISASGAGRHGV